jgi:hypothetical protein
MMSKKAILITVVFVVLMAMAIPVLAANVASLPVSGQGVTPYIIDDLYTEVPNPDGGNRTCEDVGLAFFNDANYYEYTSGKYNWDEVNEVWKDDDGNIVADPFGDLNVSTDGTYVSWGPFNHAGLAAIVKGGSDANVYVYDDALGTFYIEDSGLASPPNASGGPAGLSNLTFCWNPEDVEECWEGETAWAANGDIPGEYRYTSRGNWATYLIYAADKTVTLFAGQYMDAGTVHFSDVVNGEVTITITLNAGWRFYDDPNMENVKIQGYESYPSGNPAPGQFDNKGYATESPFVIVVPAANYYGVHVDVEQSVECLVEEDDEEEFELTAISPLLRPIFGK